MVKKVLVIGKGFLGKYILNECIQQNLQAIGTHNTNHSDGLKLDVQNINSVDDCISKTTPDLVINCASNTQIDFLEKNSNIAFSVNANGAKNVAIVSEKYKIRLIHISTDSVFDGKKGMYGEDDIPNPINVYAQSKFLGEQLVKENSNDNVIVRTNFYGINQEGNFLFNWVLKNLQQNMPIIGFTDVIFTPLEISNLSKMILEISARDYKGVIHLASNEPISKYEFALQIAKIFGFSTDLIKKGSIDDHTNLVAKRPKNTSLLNKKATQILDTKIVSLNNWLYDIKEIFERQ